MSDEPVVNGAHEPPPLHPEQEKRAEEPKAELKVESKEEKKAFSWLYARAAISPQHPAS